MIDLALDSRIFITTPLDEALQELDILFNTTNTELIGDPSYGTNFEQFLWQSNDASSTIKRYIQEKAKDTYFLSQMIVDIDVEILDGEYRNIYDVKITVSDGTSQGNRQYQLR